MTENEKIFLKLFIPMYKELGTIIEWHEFVKTDSWKGLVGSQKFGPAVLEEFERVYVVERREFLKSNEALKSVIEALADAVLEPETGQQ